MLGVDMLSEHADTQIVSNISFAQLANKDGCRCYTRHQVQLPDALPLLQATPGQWIMGSLSSIALLLLGGGVSLACTSLLVLWLVTRDSSSAPDQLLGEPEAPSDGMDTDGDITDDESPSAPQMPSEMQGHMLQVWLQRCFDCACLWFCKECAQCRLWG